MYGYICPECGCSLDPGEKCDCKSEKELQEIKQDEYKAFVLKATTVERDGQYRLVI